MFQVRKIVAFFAVESEDPELVLSQYRAVARQVPLLYSVLILNTLALAVTHLHSSPLLLSVFLPGVFIVACCIRVLAWCGAGRKSLTAQQAARALRATTCATPLLGLGCLIWALFLFRYGDAFAQVHTAFFLSITSIACIFCLMHLRPAALLLILTVAVPSTITFVLTGKPVLVAIAINFALVAACMVMVMFQHYRDFIALIESRRELIARQSETQRLSDENSRLASIDTLTNLANRRGFFRDLDAALSQQHQTEMPVAVGLIDLDGFKPINDVLGHAIGDVVLREVGRRMRGLGGAGRSLARMGGDEFGFILTGCPDSEIEDFATALCLRLRAPYVMATATAELSASVGIAVYPRAGRTTAQLLERADYALYYAKQNRRGLPVMFSHAHQSEIREAARLEQALRHADLEAELSLAFQPVFDCHVGRTVAFECLARWNSPELGSVPPADFIKAAERSDLINQLTEVLLRKALTAARDWPESLRIAFNLSVRDIASDDPVRRIGEIVRASGIDPARIELEITETAVMRDFDQARQALLSLKALGVQIALDDFGTGYSSLSYVHRLPFDKIKVDRSFTADIEADSACLSIVKTVLDLCRNLKLGCVIEGLESASQVRILRNLGCVLMQGYFFASPMNGDRLRAFLDAEGRHVEKVLGTHGPERAVRVPDRAAL